MFTIIVCVKQVPDISQSAEVGIDPKTHTLVREGAPSVLNPPDTHAIEEALRIKEKFGAKVRVLSMGPPQAKEVLKETISMGADETVLVSDTHFAGADTLATSLTLSAAIKKIGDFDLILCGKQAIDGDTAQVPPEVAEFLGIPVLTFVREIREIREGSAIVQRLVERGVERVETELPALFTVVGEINTPRLPSLRGKLAARHVEIPVWGIEYLGLDTDKVGLDGSPTQVIRTFAPEQRREGEILDGSADSVIERVVDFIRN
jgi:electron transfer flavoprotein beta subunit